MSGVMLLIGAVVATLGEPTGGGARSVAWALVVVAFVAAATWLYAMEQGLL